MKENNVTYVSKDEWDSIMNLVPERDKPKEKDQEYYDKIALEVQERLNQFGLDKGMK